MTSTLTRRGLVAGAPAAILAAAVPAITAGGSDAELLALRGPWLATLAEFNAALDIKGKVEAQVYTKSV